jgi:hypothetical protein
MHTIRGGPNLYKDESFKIMGAGFDHNYLKATGHRLGLLVNFGNYPELEWQRIVR